MTSIAGLVAADAILAALGASLLMAFGAWDRLPRWSRPGPALLAGFAAAATVLPPLLYVGVGPTPIVVGALAAVSLAAGAAIRRRAERARPDVSGGGAIAGLVLAVLLVPFSARAALEPVVKFDAYADWSLKARLIYGHGGLILGALDPQTLGAAYQAGHREYPLGLPTTEAFLFHLSGGAGSRVIHLQALAILLAFAATTWSLLRPRVDPAILGACLCLLVVSPSLHTQVLSTYADVPLASLWALAACCLGLWLAGDGGDRLALATLFAAAALAVKQEGIPLDLALYAVALACVCATRQRARLPGLALSAAVVAASAVPWQVRTRTLGLHDADIDPSAGRMSHQTHTVPSIVHRLAVELLGTRWPGIVPLAIVAALWLVWRQRDRVALAFLALLATSSFALVLIYWNARIPVHGLLVESAERVVLGPVFLAVIALPLLLDRAVRAAAPVLAPPQAADARAWRPTGRPRPRQREQA